MFSISTLQYLFCVNVDEGKAATRGKYFFYLIRLCSCSPSLLMTEDIAHNTCILSVIKYIGISYDQSRTYCRGQYFQETLEQKKKKYHKRAAKPDTPKAELNFTFPSTVTQLVYLYYAFSIFYHSSMASTTGCLAHCCSSVLS